MKRTDCLKERQSSSLISKLFSVCIQLLINTKRIVKSWFYWCPTSEVALQNSEKLMLSYVKTGYVGEQVDIGSGWGLEQNNIWTLKFNTSENTSSRLTPIVLIHGFGTGVGFWALNLDALSSSKRRVYAFDVLGFGRSSRPYFDSQTNEVEWSLVESIERWRIAVNLNEKFILLGHGFGAYLALSYALHFPDNVSHIILVDAWGIQSHQQANQNRTLSQHWVPVWVKMANALLQSINPLTPLRAAGPWGLTLLQKLRPDLKRKFFGLMGNKNEVVLQYIYHCNAQPNASGEMAFKTLSLPSGWPRYPMMHRIGDLNSDIGLTFIYGSRTWNDRQPAFQIAYLLGEDRVTVNIIQGAGYHVFADKPREFNELVNLVCQLVDTKLWNNVDDAPERIDE